MDFLEALYRRLALICAATWPEVVRAGADEPPGLFEVEHLELVPFADLTPPYAAILIEAAPATADFGLASDAYVPRVEVYYVCAVDGPSGPVREKLMALRAALWTTDQDDFRVLSVDELTWSRRLLPNEIFAAKGQMTRAGRLTLTALVGECLNP